MSSKKSGDPGRAAGAPDARARAVAGNCGRKGIPVPTGDHRRGGSRPSARRPDSVRLGPRGRPLRTRPVGLAAHPEWQPNTCVTWGLPICSGRSCSRRSSTRPWLCARTGDCRSESFQRTSGFEQFLDEQRQAAVHRLGRAHAGQQLRSAPRRGKRPTHGPLLRRGRKLIRKSPAKIDHLGDTPLLPGRHGGANRSQKPRSGCVRQDQEFGMPGSALANCRPFRAGPERGFHQPALPGSEGGRAGGDRGQVAADRHRRERQGLQIRVRVPQRPWPAQLIARAAIGVRTPRPRSIARPARSSAPANRVP